MATGPVRETPWSGGRGRAGPHDGGHARGRSPDRLRRVRVVVPGGVQGVSRGGECMSVEIRDRAGRPTARYRAGATPWWNGCGGLRAGGRNPRRRAVDRRRTAGDDRAGRRRPRRRTAVAPRPCGRRQRRAGISLTDALANPAVTRAQELVGAPSYEDSLAALGRRSARHVSEERSVKVGGRKPAAGRTGARTNASGGP